MFDFDVGKLLLFGVVALVVIGPRDLPRAMRFAGQIMGRLRRMKAEAQSQFNDVLREADVRSLTQELRSVEASAQALSRDAATAMRGSLAGASGNSEPPTAPAFASPEMRDYLAPATSAAEAEVDAGPSGGAT